MRTPALVPLLLLALAVGACASKGDAGLPLVQRTKIDYDSTRDGPRPPPPEPSDPADASKCAHVWEALSRATHVYWDTSGEIPMSALCTPTVCHKCGLVRHECEKRSHR